jgi:hypothetical protein
MKFFTKLSSLSKVHANVWTSDTNVFIKILSLRSRMRVNEKEITIDRQDENCPEELNHGDVVKIGADTLTYYQYAKTVLRSTF